MKRTKFFFSKIGKLLKQIMIIIPNSLYQINAFHQMIEYLIDFFKIL